LMSGERTLFPVLRNRGRDGRDGRLMATLFLMQRGILPTPLWYLSAFFEATRREYYEGLPGVTGSGE